MSLPRRCLRYSQAWPLRSYSAKLSTCLLITTHEGTVAGGSWILVTGGCQVVLPSAMRDGSGGALTRGGGRSHGGRPPAAGASCGPSRDGPPVARPEPPALAVG